MLWVKSSTLFKNTFKYGKYLTKKKQHTFHGFMSSEKYNEWSAFTNQATQQKSRPRSHGVSGR